MATLTEIERAEAVVADDSEAAVRAVLALARKNFLRLAEGKALVAAPTLQGVDAAFVAILAEWSRQVNERVVPAIEAVFRRGAGPELGPVARQRLAEYLAAVPSRLTKQGVAGAEVGLTQSAARLGGVTTAEEMFDRARVALAFSVEQGHSTRRTSQRLATVLAWEPDRGAARREVARLDARIDTILDAIGPPGTPSREAARLNDPLLNSLQQQRSRFVLLRDDSESHWQKRATRIARTETTGALNGGEIAAMQDQQAADPDLVLRKTWLATSDRRTRDSHVSVDGECVPLDGVFSNGLRWPGDPNGPAREVVNCRCTQVVEDGACPE